MERQFGPYRLVRQVAVGGMAEIHLAKAKGIAGFEKYVALKMIHPNFAEDEQFIDMLVDEAKIAVQLTHHNIAQTFDLGRVGDTYYISMEYVDGADLYKVLRRASEQDIDFPLDVCAFIAKEISSGLDYAHRKRDVTGQQLGIVHRDVSPQNVLLSYAGEIKLVDFGIAKATMKVKQTAAGVIKGKYYYMSPEQASGGNVDLRSDIFSAGIVLYEMLTGQMLYLEEDLHRLLDMVRRADIAPPSKLRRGIPTQLERIVMRALAKLPADRYQSGADMASDLERFLHAYSPVFTPAKVVSLLRRAVGEATLNVESEPAESIEVLDDSQLMRAPGEMRDSNSVIFRVKPRPLNDFPPIDTNAATDSGVAEPPTARRAGTSGEAAARGVEPRRPGTSGEAAARSAEASARLGDSTAKGVAAAPRRPAEPRRPSKEHPKMRPPTAPLMMPPSADPVPAEIEEDEPPRRTMPRISRQQATVNAAARREFDEDTRELPDGFNEEDSGPAAAPAPAPDASKAKPVPSLPRNGVRAAAAFEPTGPAVPVLPQAATPASKPVPRIAPSSSAPPIATAVNVMPVFGLEDIEGGDSTLVSSIPSFQADTGFEGEVENTMVQARVPVPEHTDYGETQIRSQPVSPEQAAKAGSTEEDGPTMPGRRASTRARPVAAPAALAARNPTPSVSELRRPRPSRSTPAGGSPNLLQAIVSAPGSEPMPAAPRAMPPPTPARAATPPPIPVVSAPTSGFEPTQPAQPTYVPVAGPDQPTGFSLPPMQAAPPMAAPAPPQAMMDLQQMPGVPMAHHGVPHHLSQPSPSGSQPVPQHLSAPHELPPAYAHLSAQFPMPTAQMTGQMTGQGLASGSYPPAQQAYGGGYPFMPGGAFPQGSAGATMTGRMRAMEIDEIPAHFRIKREGPRWFVLAAIALTAVAAAASVTFLVLRANRQAAVASAALRIESMPGGATVYVDDSRLPDPTPLVYKGVQPGGRYKVRVELARHVSYVKEVVISSAGGEEVLTPNLMPLTGTLRITSLPPGADIFINGTVRGRTPAVVSDLDLDNVKKIELRLSKYDPYQRELLWGDKTELTIDATLTPAGQKPR